MQLLCFSLGAVLLAVDIVSERMKDRVGFDRLVAAMQLDSDAAVVDELHSFAFRYLNPQRNFFVMSRSYVCENGKFWNVYGWNPCSEMKDVASSAFVRNLESKKPNRLLVVSRGRFSGVNYRSWAESVSKVGYVNFEVVNYRGPFVPLLGVASAVPE